MIFFHPYRKFVPQKLITSPKFSEDTSMGEKDCSE